MKAPLIIRCTIAGLECLPWHARVGLGFMLTAMAIWFGSLVFSVWVSRVLGAIAEWYPVYRGLQ